MEIMMRHVIDVQSAPVIAALDRPLMRCDRQAHRIALTITDGGEDAVLDGWRVLLMADTPEGVIVHACEKDGNQVTCVLNDAVYARSGDVKLVVKLENDEKVITLLRLYGSVEQSHGENILLPEGVINWTVLTEAAENELTRKQHEAQRQQSEAQRQLNETARQQGETARNEALAAELDRLSGTIQKVTENENGIQALRKRIYARNLLDNSDFANPVNQRGQTSYTGAKFTIDRWWLQSSTTITLTAGSHLTLSGSWNMRQKTEGLKTGERYTFAVCARCEGSAFTAHMGIDNSDALLMPLTSEWTTYIYTRTLDSKDDGLHYVSISKANTTGSMQIKWAALYEGEYTADTLPDYAPKGYAAELAECKRYFRKWPVRSYIGIGGSGTTIGVPITLDGIEMRAAPEVSISSAEALLSGSWQSISNKSATVKEKDHVNCSFTMSSGITVNNCYNIRFAIEISAEI